MKTVAVVIVSLALLHPCAHPSGAAPARHAGKAATAGKKPKPARVSRTAAQSRTVVDAVLNGAIDQVWTHADYYWHEGRYEDHVSICRFMMRADPSFTESYSSGGWLLENLGRNDEALAVYRAAARAVPTNWRPLHDLGYFYYQQKRYPEAIETLEKAVGLSPPAFVWHILAHSYEKSGDRTRSIATWRRCLKLFPEDGAAGHNLRRLEEGERPESTSADDGSG
jgi:tetratricopeptide (TPR) repeat protein